MEDVPARPGGRVVSCWIAERDGDSEGRVYTTPVSNIRVYTRLHLPESSKPCTTSVGVQEGRQGRGGGGEVGDDSWFRIVVQQNC